MRASVYNRVCDSLASIRSGVARYSGIGLERGDMMSLQSDLYRTIADEFVCLRTERARKRLFDEVEHLFCLHATFLVAADRIVPVYLPEVASAFRWNALYILRDDVTYTTYAAMRRYSRTVTPTEVPWEALPFMFIPMDNVH